MHMFMTAAACSMSIVGVSPEAVNAQLQTMLAPSVVMQDTADQKIVKGSIKSIADDKSSLVLTVSEDKEQTVSINKKTTYTLDGETSTLDLALKAGRDATVTHVDGVAVRIDVRTAK